MRRQFGKTVVDLSEKDSKLILITGDVEHCMDDYKRMFPERFFNVGLCEQSMISMAAGLASEGYKPVVYSITPFVIERPFEQVKLDIDEQNLPVILVGYSDYPTVRGNRGNGESYFPRRGLPPCSSVSRGHHRRRSLARQDIAGGPPARSALRLHIQ